MNTKTKSYKEIKEDLYRTNKDLRQLVVDVKRLVKDKQVRMQSLLRKGKVIGIDSADAHLKSNLQIKHKLLLNIIAVAAKSTRFMDSVSLYVSSIDEISSKALRIDITSNKEEDYTQATEDIRRSIDHITSHLVYSENLIQEVIADLNSLNDLLDLLEVGPD